MLGSNYLSSSAFFCHQISTTSYLLCRIPSATSLRTTVFIVLSFAQFNMQSIRYGDEEITHNSPAIDPAIIPSDPPQLLLKESHGKKVYVDDWRTLYMPDISPLGWSNLM